MIRLVFLTIVLSFTLFSCSYEAINDRTADNLVPLFTFEAVEDEEMDLSLVDLMEGSHIPEHYNLLEVRSDNSFVSINEGTNISFKTHKHFFGKDLIEVFWSEKINGSVILTAVEVNVKPASDSPIAFNDHVDNLDSAITLDVLANDIEVDGENLELTFVESSEFLEAEIIDGKVLLTPLPDFDSSEELSLVYKIQDSSGLEAQGQINFNKEIEENEKVPLKLVFIGSTSNPSEGECSDDSETVLNKLNTHFNKSGGNGISASHIQVSLDGCEEVTDDSLYNHCDPRISACNDFDKILERYGKPGVMSLVFVNDIEGPVAGIAKLNRIPQSDESAVVAQKSSIRNGGTVYTHELGHMLGLDHSQQVGAAENEWIPFGSCGQSLRYFQRGYESNLASSSGYSDPSGVLWNDHSNLMKSEVIPGESGLGFYSEGYSDIFSTIFNCYRARSL